MVNQLVITDCSTMRRMRFAFNNGILLILFFVSNLNGQQQADSSFRANVENPRFESGKGPVVAIDEAHGNFHTKSGRYAPFAAVLEADGFQVVENEEPFTVETLDGIDVLVIANALHEDNQQSWKLPTPSAFSDDEIDALDEWIQAGGSLFLIADHMPFPGAAAALAKRFQVDMINGFAFEHPPNEPDNFIRAAAVFRREDDAIRSHPITDGRDESEKVNQVATFTGQVFRVSDNAEVLLTMNRPCVILSPETAWQFAADTKTEDATGLSQGAAIEHEKGRVVVFGEAAMFTSQTQGNSRRASSGLSAPISIDNQKLLLNIVRWLAHSMDESD